MDIISVLNTLASLINFVVIIGILTIIFLMLVRLAVTYADLNPFGQPMLLIRRLTDPFVVPVRRGLVGYGINPNAAPVIAILIAVLFGWLGITLSSSAIGTLGGIIVSLQRGDVVRLIGHALYGALDLYGLLIFVRFILSWFVGYANSIMRFLVRITDPVLLPLRRIIPPIGGFDISALILLLFIIPILKAAIAGTLLR